MHRIGLTGGIASGKSTVANRFKARGLSVSSADHFAREVVQPGSAGLAEVVDAFGDAVILADGSLDRQTLRQRIFSNPDDRAQLERILHPRIRAATNAWCDTQTEKGARYVLLEIPLLIETAQQHTMERVIVVDVPESVQVERVQRRDKGSAEDARRIIATQASRSERLHAATDVLLNDRDIDSLLADIDALAERFDTLYP